MIMHPSRCFSFPHRLLVLCFVLLPGFLFAQNKTASKKSPVVNGWTLNATVNGVECFYKITQCAEKKVVLLRFNNTTNKPVNISWGERFVVKSGSTNANKTSYGKKQLKLSPGITEQADCGSSVRLELIAMPVQTTPVYTEEVITFDFSDLTVTN
jgi:hypothetical protein